ncbi:ABC transporter, transmembrane region, type 1 [Thermosinus carboxydivorans Nor1]|uniref:ABC transporter, transmembrane region, type 1 n=1 Tax=Thermosinus carboxydivorans Nor1 TaxID=401526 RepID=A1HT26_9FIRM|nr:thiol reductant ABC exporter subunit CydC [Thermosinus carboxydivorans]EAX46793.1 ABC transporter, transmembrane region, type 1 [Thermosinus carboxydivorans Nor1]
MMGTAVRLLKIVIRPAAATMTLALVFAVLTVASGTGLLAAAAFLIASAALHPPLSALSLAIVGVRFFGLSRAVFRYAERYFAHDATLRCLSRIRVWFFAALEPLAPARLAGEKSGDLVGRMVADVDVLQHFYIRVVLPPLAAVLVLAGMWLFLAPFNVQFAYILTAAFLAAGLLLPLIISRISRFRSGQLLESSASLKAALVDILEGMTELAAFNQVEAYVRQTENKAAALAEKQKAAARLAALANAAASLIMHSAVWATTVLAVVLAEKGDLAKVYIAVLALAVQGSFEAVMPLPLAAHYLEHSLAAARRLFAVIDQGAPAVDAGAVCARPANCDIVVTNLSFRYSPQATDVLRDISFTVPAGGRIAIVGPSGAGKSTVVSLLLRFWDYDRGSIRLGGRELKTYPPAVLRDMIGVVPQRPYLFNTSIEDNIRLAKPDAAREEIAAAVRQAAFDGLVDVLPDGLATMVGQNGRTLSGGQRQRVAIARVFLKAAPILLLDEPTAGLDAATEREVLAALDKFMAGRTTILITHRLIGLENMDEILVLYRGRIVERGRQAELLARQGLFYQMWRLQNDRLM